MSTPPAKRPHPLRSRAFAAAAVTAAVATGTLVGVLDADTGAKVTAAAGLWLTALTTGGILVRSAEPVVTPTVDPRADDGRQLIPAASPAQLAAAWHDDGDGPTP